MNFKTFYITLLCCLGFIPVIGQGMERGAPQIPMYEDIDTDSSGCISRKEASDYRFLHMNFDTVDTDNNNRICVEEYSQYVNKGLNQPDEVEIPEPGAAPMR